MNILKARHKKQMTRVHREHQYLIAINGVIDGKVDVNYATLRWIKLKEVR